MVVSFSFLSNVSNLITLITKYLFKFKTTDICLRDPSINLAIPSAILLTPLERLHIPQNCRNFSISSISYYYSYFPCCHVRRVGCKVFHFYFIVFVDLNCCLGSIFLYIEFHHLLSHHLLSYLLINFSLVEPPSHLSNKSIFILFLLPLLSLSFLYLNLHLINYLTYILSVCIYTFEFRKKDS